MCFAPYISLSTFIIEFLLALFFLLKNPKDKVNRIIALLSFLLGLYQLNEFLICTTGANFFTRGAIIVTALLPAIGITYGLIMWRKKIRYYWHLLIYSPTIFFVVMFSLPFYYQESAVCNSVFLTYPGTGLLGDFYGLYYLTYISAAAILFYFAASNNNNKYEKRLLHLGMLGMLIFTIPTFIFLQFLPALYISFPSVLCEFALLLAIELIIVIWYKDKHKLNY